MVKIRRSYDQPTHKSFKPFSKNLRYGHREGFGGLTLFHLLFFLGNAAFIVAFFFVSAEFGVPVKFYVWTVLGLATLQVLVVSLIRRSRLRRRIRELAAQSDEEPNVP